MLAGSSSLQDNQDTKDTKVKHILAKKVVAGKHQYLVHWEGLLLTCHLIWTYLIHPTLSNHATLYIQ